MVPCWAVPAPGWQLVASRCRGPYRCGHEQHGRGWPTTDDLRRRRGRRRRPLHGVARAGPAGSGERGHRGQGPSCGRRARLPPSTVAPALNAVPTKLLAMVVADIANPLFVDVIRGAEAAAEAAGYTMLLFDTQESDVRERQAAETFLPAVEGLVLTSPRLSDSGIRTLAKQRPIIVLNRVVTGLPSVLTDGARGVRRAAEHLGQLGHREISYIAGPEASWADGVRWRGLEEAGIDLELRVRRIGPNQPTVEGGARAARRWAESPTTAVIAFNDIMAIGFIRGQIGRA